MHSLGIDLGGTKIEGVVLTPEGREKIRLRTPTERDEGYDAIVARVADLYRRLCREIGGEPHTFGIGTPGSISPRTGLLRNSNTVCLNGRPVQRDLEAALSREIAIMNDANCFALAEATVGAGRNHHVVFGVIMGTGCGGGISMGGEIVMGGQGIAGEWGHMSVDPEGERCYCGKRGCVETLISGGGLERRWHDEFGERREVPAIIDDFRSGDEGAVAFVARFLSDFGRCLANVINLLDPDVVVLGGGLSQIDELYSLGVAEVADNVFSDSFETPIVKNQLGDSAGVLGAALIGC
jgi:fructokinase